VSFPLILLAGAGALILAILLVAVTARK